MEEIRCGACGRKLGEGIFARLAIKCPRCGTLNQFQSAPSGFVGDTIAAFRDAGAQLYNEAILVTSAGSLPIRAGKAFEVSRKLGRTHQQVLVFVKGDARRATAACGAVR